MISNEDIYFHFECFACFPFLTGGAHAHEIKNDNSPVVYIVFDPRYEAYSYLSLQYSFMFGDEQISYSDWNFNSFLIRPGLMTLTMQEMQHMNAPGKQVFMDRKGKN